MYVNNESFLRTSTQTQNDSILRGLNSSHIHANVVKHNCLVCNVQRQFSNYGFITALPHKF